MDDSIQYEYNEDAAKAICRELGLYDQVVRRVDALPEDTSHRLHAKGQFTDEHMARIFTVVKPKPEKS